jgi:CheY-like chemotaxis protein
MNKGTILWADDEIEFLEPHVLFMRGKGYEVITVTNGDDVIALVKKGGIDLVLLDESMPGMSGLETLIALKEIQPHLPVVMVTKNEEEHLMEDAIGYQIDDYLTKPINPSQILLACKKILEKAQITEDKLARNFPSQISSIAMDMMNVYSWQDWTELYQKLTSLSLYADAFPDKGFSQPIHELYKDANSEFGKYIKSNYASWVDKNAKADGRPVFSVDVVERGVVPLLKTGNQVVFIIIDGMRLDQWLLFEEKLSSLFKVERELYFSILPTATPFARNAIFSGLYPEDLIKVYPDVYERTEDENSANRYEKEALTSLLARNGIRYNSEIFYTKIFNERDAGDLEKRVNDIFTSPIAAIVFNFVDILAHSRSDLQVLKEIAPNESAFRSLTLSWFEHSKMYSLFKALAEKDVTIVVTSDHGSVRGLHPLKIITDKEASHNLRYKFGRNLKSGEKNTIRLKDPSLFRLPKFSMNTECIIALQDYYFVYQQNYHKYVNLYRDCFQHGGVSLEEVIVPLAKLNPR